MATARGKHESARFSWKIQSATILALAGIGIHARGALCEETQLWNSRPYDIDLRAGRIWDWRYLQFLAGLVYPPLPGGAYSPVPLNERIDFTNEQANKFLWFGWSDPESQIRWSDNTNAAIVFALEDTADLTLIIRAAPFVVSGLKERQRLAVKLNGEALESVTLTDPAAADLSLSLPRPVP